MPFKVLWDALRANPYHMLHIKSDKRSSIEFKLTNPVEWGAAFTTTNLPKERGLEVLEGCQGFHVYFLALKRRYETFERQVRRHDRHDRRMTKPPPRGTAESETPAKPISPYLRSSRSRLHHDEERRSGGAKRGEMTGG